MLVYLYPLNNLLDKRTGIKHDVMLYSLLAFKITMKLEYNFIDLHLQSSFYFVLHDTM